MQYDLHATDITLFASDGVRAQLTRVSPSFAGARSQAGVLRLDYEFKGAGHALIRVPVSLTLAPNYVFRFRIKGSAPANTLEFKCVDATADGENVWWVNRPNFKVTSRWQTMPNKKRHFTYAWGPVNAPLGKVSFVELTVSATAGGKGTVYFSDLSYEPLADESVQSESVSFRASSAKARAASLARTPAQAHDGWRSSSGERQYLYLDFARLREFDGLVVDFGDDFAVDCDVQASNKSGAGKKTWRTIATVRGGARRRQYHALPESEAAALRLAFKRSVNGRGYHVRSVRVQATGFAATTSKFFMAVAADLDLRRGFMPRYFHNEQSFWTVVGVSGGREKAIINEEGMIEPALEAPSLEPFLYVEGANGEPGAEGKLLTWADGAHSHSLVDGYLPMPIVLRQHRQYGLELKVEALAQGESDASTLYARYTVRNCGQVPRRGSFYVALRHYQVNPTWQFLNTPGGFTPVKSLRAHAGCLAVTVNDAQEIFPLTPPRAFGATRFSQGDIVEHLARGRLPHRHSLEDLARDRLCAERELSIEDLDGYCSGALEYGFNLAPGRETSFVLALPYNKKSKVKPFTWARAEAIREWNRTLQSVDFDLPAYPQLVDTIKSQLAYILVNRDGVALQPGSRCYRRTWIRDGSLTSEALLQLGLKSEVRDFIEWFAPFQYEDGKVPCCVDKRGADPTPEHDSHGEFIYLVVEYYRYSKDREFLRRLFPRLLKAVEYIDKLRRQRLTAEYAAAGDRGHLRGLMPESISHEGYSAKPAHSYWDDLFALKGLEDALFAARELGEAEGDLATIHDDFRRDLLASMRASMARWQIDFIPGAADRGDFDATSTTIALDPCDLSADLPAELASTFEAYWRYFERRRKGEVEWEAYTPYEWRVVSTLARLGKIERAHQALAYFMADRRPAGWNHWAEVVFKDPLTPRFIGDAPHGWVGSDFLRAVRTLFVYEKPQALVVGSGLPLAWLNAGLTIRNLATEHGTLSLSVRRNGDSLSYRVEGDIAVPVELVLPVSLRPDDDERRTVVVASLPAVIDCQLK
ncbi:MAG: hypothetical protein JSS83_16945 [Cyanobacteria bacterium SZAS LIN-3]|nr:hypothetical protein [Cyanobacteria bacterium SZAS LIN-3]MBS2010859.1 hypothetical protein [Cyanobacteria bacterium SZAS TMP-1]